MLMTDLRKFPRLNGLPIGQTSFDGQVGLVNVFWVLGVEAVQQLEVQAWLRRPVEFSAVEHPAARVDGRLECLECLVVRCLLRSLCRPSCGNSRSRTCFGFQVLLGGSVDPILGQALDTHRFISP